MRAMIIGGDKVDGTRQALVASGYADVLHWSGRKRSDLRREMPQGVAHMVIMLDFVNHNLAKRMKAIARERDISVVYVGRKQCAGPGVPTRLDPLLQSACA